ncbi:MAG: APC family permease [Tissierellia bacterium]|nr:APC family permease [Tissierellia bacterium]
MLINYKRKMKRGSMSLVDFFMLSFGAMVGVGWAVSSNNWIFTSGGVIPATVGFIIGTLLLLPIGFCYSELMASLPASGGVMLYAYRAFGTFISFIGGWFVALAYITILPWEAIYINDILMKLFPALANSPVIYTVLGSNITLNGIIIGIVLAVVLFIINVVGSEKASRLQTKLSMTIIVIGFIVIIASFIKFDPNNLIPSYQAFVENSHTNMLGGIISMVVIVPFFMAGFDTIPQTIEDSKREVNFSKIAKVLAFSILFAGLFYSLIIISTGAVTDWREYSQMPAPAMALMLKDVYGGGIGQVLYYLVMIGTIAGLFSTWNGMFMASARLLESMGRTNLLPQFFKTEFKKYKTPKGASIFCFFAAAVGPLVGSNLIATLTSLGSVAFVIGWFLTGISSVKLRKKEPRLYRPFRAPGGMFTLIVGSIISLVIIILSFLPTSVAFMGNIGVVLFFVWTGLGLIFYLLTNRAGHKIEKYQRDLMMYPWLLKMRTLEKKLKEIDDSEIDKENLDIYSERFLGEEEIEKEIKDKIRKDIESD